MKKFLLKNHKTLFLSIAVALISIFMLTMLIQPVSSALITTSAGIYENTANYVSVSVSAFDTDGQETQLSDSGSSTIVRGDDTRLKAFESYRWKNTKYLVVDIDSISNIPDVIQGETYSYTYYVDYYPLEIASNGELNVATYAQKSIKLMDTKSVTSKSDISTRFYFFLDDYANTTLRQNTMTPFANGKDVLTDTSLGYDYSTQGGWGVYIFSFECQGQITYSDIVEITPTKLSELADKTPKITATPAKDGNQSVNGKFIFSIDDEFAFVNRSYIKWYLNGTGSDGTKYVLTPADKTPAKENSLFTTEQVTRTGINFTLDTKIQGKWKATAVIKEGDLTKSAISDEVSTIKPFSTTAIIWIVTAVTVVAVIVVAIIISVTIKKEKTW